VCPGPHFGRGTRGSFYDAMREWFVCACWLSPSSVSPTVPALRSGSCDRVRPAAVPRMGRPGVQGARAWRLWRRRPGPRGPWGETTGYWPRSARGACAARESCRAPGLVVPGLGGDCLRCRLLFRFRRSCWSRPPQMPNSPASVAYLRQSTRTRHAAQISLAFVPGSPWDGKKTSGSSPTHRPRPCHSPSAGAAGPAIVIGSGQTDLSVLVPSGMRDRSVSRGTGERCPWACLAPSAAGSQSQSSVV